ncbi:MAG: hypothetical protein KBB44_07535 [Bacteroidaceae bacterium]|nr:hypothetical protein [Bacteroidaceae bacterium]
MTQDQIQRLEETIRYENDKIYVALIADSPWIPGYCGDTFIDYYARNEVFIAGNRKIRKDFPDAIFVPSWWVEYGMAAEPTGFGCPTCFFEDNLPHMYPLTEDLETAGEFFGNLRMPDPKADGFMPLILNQQRYYQKLMEQDGEEVYMVCARGPFTVASHMFTVTQLLMLMMTDPEAADKLLSKTVECVKLWLEAQLDNVKTAKAVMVLDDVCGYFSPEDFKTLCMPYMKQVFDAFPEVRRYFHNDFTSNSCYPYLAEMGVEVFNFTHMQEIGESRKLVGDKVVFMGNVPPMLLAQGDPKTVYETTKSVIESYVAANGSHHGLLIGPGGGMPMGAVKPNIDAMIQAVKDYNLTL